VIRILSCAKCGDGLARTHDGRPYWLRALPEHTVAFSYLCYGCHTPQQVTQFDFARLPPLAITDLLRHDLGRLLLSDLTLGGALQFEEALDLYQAGFTAGELQELERCDETAGADA